MTYPARLNALLYALLLSFGAPAMAVAEPDTPPAASAAVVSPAHAANLRQIIENIQLHEYLRRQPAPAGIGDFERQFALLFARHTTEDELIRRLTPSLARIIHPQLAAQLAKLVNSPAFRARESRAATGSFGSPSSAEAAELRRIDADPAMAEFRRLRPAMTTAVSNTVRQWSMEFGAQLNASAWALIDKLEDDLRTAPESSYRSVEIGSVGFEPLDQVIRSIGKSIIRFNKAFKRQEKEMKAAHYDEYFIAKNLANTQYLANAERVIDQAEWILENTLTELNAAIKEREEGIAKSSMSSQPEFRAKNDNTTAMLYSFAGDYGEAVRRMTTQHRKVVAFMQTHLFNVTVKDDKLIFSDENDLQQATEVLDQLRQARAKVEEVVANLAARETQLRGQQPRTPSSLRGGS